MVVPFVLFPSPHGLAHLRSSCATMFNYLATSMLIVVSVPSVRGFLSYDISLLGDLFSCALFLLPCPRVFIGERIEFLEANSVTLSSRENDIFFAQN